MAERKRVPLLSERCRWSPLPLETSSLQPPPLTIAVCRCHPPAFCYGAELRAAARMGPPERRERRAKLWEGRAARAGCGNWEGSGWRVQPGFGVRSPGRLGRGALKAHVPECSNGIPLAALRVAAQVESSPPCGLSPLWADAKPRMLSCPGTPTVPGVTLACLCVSALRPLEREMTLGWPVLDCRLRLNRSVNKRKLVFLSCSSAPFYPWAV